MVVVFVDMMLQYRYYNVMSMTKQIIIGVIATMSLLLFGVGSYYASKQLFPDPTSGASGSVTPTPSVTSNVPTVSDMKRLEPRNLQAKVEGDNVVVTFETAEKVGTLLYVTPSKTEKIAQAMKDYNNGVAIAGKWFNVTSEAEGAVNHTSTFPKTVLNASGDSYYYVVVSYKKYWLPYGSVTDYQNGVAEPYIIKL